MHLFACVLGCFLCTLVSAARIVYVLNNRKGGVFFKFCFGNEDASLSTYLLLALAVVFKNLLRSLCNYTLA